MYKFVNKILKETNIENNTDNDSFFQPKIKEREKKLKEGRKENLNKIKIGLQNVKITYQNKD